MHDSKAPFDNVLKTENGIASIFKTIDHADVNGVETVYMGACKSRVQDTGIDLRTVCTKFEDSIKIGVAAH